MQADKLFWVPWVGGVIGLGALVAAIAVVVLTYLNLRRPDTLSECDFRYNERETTDGQRAETALKGIVGKRLTYEQPIGKDGNSM